MRGRSKGKVVNEERRECRTASACIWGLVRGREAWFFCDVGTIPF